MTPQAPQEPVFTASDQSAGTLFLLSMLIGALDARGAVSLPEIFRVAREISGCLDDQARACLVTYLDEFEEGWLSGGRHRWTPTVIAGGKDESTPAGDRLV